MIDIEHILEEKPPSLRVAMASVALGVLSIAIWALASSHFISDPFSMVRKGSSLTHITLFALSIILKAFGGILQLVLLYSWSKALEKNIENTKALFQSAYEKVSENKKESLSLFLLRLSQMKLSTWAFVLYAIFYILGGMVPLLSLINIPAYIFLAIYLHSLFYLSSELSKLKNITYDYFLGKPSLIPEIKERNIILVALFSIATLNIYWFYLLIELTKEISNFINTDKRARRYVIEALKGG